MQPSLSAEGRGFRSYSETVEGDRIEHLGGRSSSGVIDLLNELDVDRALSANQAQKILQEAGSPRRRNLVQAAVRARREERR